jgi:hypothetical protein
MMGTLNRLSVLVVVLLGLAAFGCGDDAKDEGGNTGGSGNTGGDTATGGGDATGGGGNGENCGQAFDECAGDTPIFDDATTCCIGLEDATTLCIAQTLEEDPSQSTDDPACGAGCTCRNCQQQMLDCGNDPTGYCTTIVQCANDVGCTGVACYAADTCQAVIDAAPEGGLGSLSVGLATEISSCVAPEMMPAVCEPTCL